MKMLISFKDFPFTVKLAIMWLIIISIITISTLCYFKFALATIIYFLIMGTVLSLFRILYYISTKE